MLYMKAMPPAVIGTKMNGNFGGVVSEVPRYAMSLAAKSVVCSANW